MMSLCRNRCRTVSRADGPLTDNRLYSALLQTLGRREYSRAELEKKFTARASERALAAALDRLAEDGYQSDERFAELFIRSRIGKGQGPAKICYDLRQRGIADEQAEAALRAAQPDWEALALAALEKRFGPSLAQQEVPRAGRFLAGRGFSSELIYRVTRASH